MHAIGIAAGDVGVWVVQRDGVAEIERRRTRLADDPGRRREPRSDPRGRRRRMWVADPYGGSVWRIEPGPKPLLRRFPLEFGVTWIAASDGAIWATNAIADKVYRIDPRRTARRSSTKWPRPRGIAVGADGVWVTTAAGRHRRALPHPRAPRDAGGCATPA